MTPALKIFILIACGLICGGGAFVADKIPAKESSPKTKLTPIENRVSRPNQWLRA